MADINQYPKAPAPFKESDQYLIIENGQTKLRSGVDINKQITDTLLDKFIELTDAPGTYVGQAGKVPVVNIDENALEFISITDAQSFIGLNDTPVSYVGQAEKILKVKASEDGVEFIEHSFLDDIDTPSTYTGSSLQVLRVNATETAVEFADPAGLLNTIIVNEESDFPAPFAGVITLADNTTYWLKDSFSMTSRIVFGANTSLVGDSQDRSTITFTGTGAFITALNNNVTVFNCSIICTANDLFDITGTGAEQVSLGFFRASCLTPGSISDISLFAAQRCSFFYYSSGSFLVSGTGNTFALNFTRFQDTATFAPTFIDLQSSVWEAILVSDSQFFSDVTATAIEGLPSDGNLTSLGRAVIANSFFRGTVIPTSGITVDDEKYRFTGNVGAQDSKAIAFGYITVPATTTIVDGSYVAIAGTWTEQPNTSRAAVAANGEITLSNLDKEAFTLSSTFTVSKNGGGTASYTFAIEEDVGAGFAAVAGTEKTVILSAATSSVTIFGLAEGVTGNKLRLSVRGNGTVDTVDATVSQFLVEA
jgi:hypothetical protein